MTCIAAARVAHAPSINYNSFCVPDACASFLPGADSDTLFRWTELMQRGVAEFLERELDGHRVTDRVLRRLRADLVCGMAGPSRRSIQRLAGSSCLMGAISLRRVGKELARDETRETGSLTHPLLWKRVLRHRLGPIDSIRLLRALERSLEQLRQTDSSNLYEMASDLATRAIQAPRSALAGCRAKRHLVQWMMSHTIGVGSRSSSSPSDRLQRTGDRGAPHAFDARRT